LDFPEELEGMVNVKVKEAAAGNLNIDTIMYVNGPVTPSPD